MISNYLFKSDRLSYSALFCTFLYVHGVLNQIQWNKLRPFHGSDSGEQTKLWSKIIVHNFAKQKDLPSLVFQFKSWVYAKPNSGLCQFGANIPPVLGLDAIAQLTKKSSFFFAKILFDIDTCKWTHPFLIHISLWGLLLSLTIHAWNWYWRPHSI